jgi:cell division protein FtsZ
VQASSTRAPLQAVKRPAPTPEQQQLQYREEPAPELETQVQMAVAEAINYAEPTYPEYDEDDGITVEPYIPAASHTHVEEAPRVVDSPVPSVYVPSSAERPDGQRRMPRTEELPAVARRSLNAQEKQEPEPRNARALFKRLASNVGINLRQPEAPKLDDTVYTSADDAAARSAIEAGAPRGSRVSAAPEGARGALDPLGRQPAQPTQKEHIEIPAFLRKHG